MNLEKYDLKADEYFMSFEFLSEGVNGRIIKVIQYARIEHTDIYNLAFGDKDPVTGEINDTIASNNGDSEKVLSTVVASLYDFTSAHNHVWIYAIGSTGARTRFYQIGINKFFEEANKYFTILGLFNNEWRPFEKGKNYSAFLAKRNDLIF